MSAWNPWAALRGRPHIIFRLDHIAAHGGGAIYARRGDRAVIVIDPALDRPARRAALAHELVHDERGGGADHPGMPEGWAAVVAGDERAVDRIVARRLVPATALANLVAQLVDVDGGVTAGAVAEAFEVPEAVAITALELFVAGAEPQRRPDPSSRPDG